MARQPKDETSLDARLKSAKLLMGPKVSKKLTIDDLEQLAFFITDAQTLLNSLGKTLNIKQVPNVLTNNQVYTNTIYSNNSPVRSYQPPQQTALTNPVVDGSGIVKGHDPNALGFGSMGDVSPYNPELDFINPPADMPIFAPSQEQLEAEARLLGSVFDLPNLPEDIKTLDINEFTQE
jgi:hypothetical protein